MIDLTNQEIFEEIMRQGQEVIDADDGRRALTFVRNMNQMLAKPEGKALANSPERGVAYQDLMTRLSFICLAALDDRTIAGLLEAHTLVGIRLIGTAVAGKIKAKLVAVPSFGERDVLRRRLREALLRNQERIGSSSISLNDKMMPPTVTNWLRKYSGAVGPRPVTLVGQNQFIATNADVKKLDEDSRRLLRELVGLFEYLKLSSQTPAGLEDPVVFRFGNQLRVLKQGNFEDIKLPPKLSQMIDQLATESEGGELEAAEPATLTSDTLPEILPTEILTAYQGTQKQQQAIVREQAKLAKKIGGKTDDLPAIFYRAVQTKNIAATVAALLLMAETDTLGNFLKADEKLRQFFDLADLESAIGAEENIAGGQHRYPAPSEG